MTLEMVCVCAREKRCECVVEAVGVGREGGERKQKCTQSPLQLGLFCSVFWAGKLRNRFASEVIYGLVLDYFSPSPGLGVL